MALTKEKAETKCKTETLIKLCVCVFNIRYEGDCN